MATLGRLALSRLLCTRPATRGFATSSRVFSQAWQQYGVIGSNIPFSIKNRYLLTLYFALFFGSAFNLPFLVVVHQIRKR